MTKKLLKIIGWSVVTSFMLFVLAFGLNQVFAANDLIPTYVGHPIPGNEPFTLVTFNNIIGTVANFMIIVAPILIIIALVLSAITIMSGGANPGLATKGKQWLGYSIYGALIIFGAGVIINTVAGIVSRDFFCQAGINILNIINVCVFH